MALHRDLTGSDLHEPKGADTAALGTVYVSDGAGSGTWKQIGTTEYNASEIKNINKYKVYYEFKDISTASTVFIPISSDSRLTYVSSILYGTITGNNAKIEFKNNGLTSMGNLDISYVSSGAGVITDLIPSSNTTIIAPGYLVLVCDGLATGTTDLMLVLDFEYV